MRILWQDLRYGTRVLRGSPGITVVAVLTLALGIAVSTTVFSWIDALLLRPYPGVRHNRLAVLETVVGDGKTEAPHLSFADFRDYQDNVKSVDGIALHRQVPVSIGEGENAQRLWCELVSGNYFATLGVKPVLGRVFSPEEYSDKPGAFVAVISHRLWRSRFQGDPAVLGKTIRMNRQQVTIVGVAPPEFRGLVSGLAFDGWVPLVPKAEADRGARHFEAIVRLKPGVTLPAAQSEFIAVASELARLHSRTNNGYSARLVPVWRAQSGAGAVLLAPLRILMAACLLVLVIACANVANLLLARSTARRTEFGIRLALGAGPGRLARQLLTESLLLAALAALASLPLVLWTANSLVSFLPATGMPVSMEFGLNVRVLLFAILAAAAAALAAGVAPVLHSLRANLNDALKQGGRSLDAKSGSSRMSALLVVSEVSLALVALVGAGMFLHSLQKLRGVHPGFDPNHVLLARLPLSTGNYSREEETQFCIRLRHRVASAPGVEAVSYGNRIPLGFGPGPWSRYEIGGYVPGRGEDMKLNENEVAPGYFELMRIPLLSGRDFRSSDGAGAPCVLIVNESFARRFSGGADPVGSRVRRSGNDCAIVGMVKDSKSFTLAEAPRPYVYVPFDQAPGSPTEGVSFYVRTTGDPLQAVPVLRREMAAIDPKSVGFEAMPLAEYTGAASFVTRLAGVVLSVLGGTALLLAAVGLYALMAYTVSRRTQEIGIRMALGADPRNVLGMIVRRGMTLTLAGLLAGLAAAIAATRLIAHMLFQVGATDPLSFAAAALFLSAVSLAACYLPARRATRVEPISALRCQ